MILQAVVLFKSNCLFLCVGEDWELFHTFFSGAMTVTRFCNPDWVFGHLLFCPKVRRLPVSSQYPVDVTVAKDRSREV